MSTERARLAERRAMRRAESVRDFRREQRKETRKLAPSPRVERPAPSPRAERTALSPRGAERAEWPAPSPRAQRPTPRSDRSGTEPGPAWDSPEGRTLVGPLRGPTALAPEPVPEATARVVYLDHNSTTLMPAQVLDAFLSWCNRGNASAEYASAREARQMMEAFRREIAVECGFELEGPKG